MKTLRTFCSVVEADIDGAGIEITDETYTALEKASVKELKDVENALENLLDFVQELMFIKEVMEMHND